MAEDDTTNEQADLNGSAGSNRKQEVGNADLFDEDYLKHLNECARFLPDDPVEEDAIAGGAHQAVANRIFSYIKDDENGKYKGMCKPQTIALLGEWGSGKSTIIKLLGKIIEEHNNPDDEKNGKKGKSTSSNTAKTNESKNKYILFTFDAWEHEGDSLREHFLSKLACTLKREIKNRKQKKAIEKASIWYDSESESPNQCGYWIAVTSMILSLISIPLIFYFLGLKNHQYTTAFQVAATLTQTFAFMAALLYVRSITKSKIKHMSLNFEQVFSNLVAVLPEDHTLIIVVDNLDRLDTENARKCWATLQSIANRRGDTGIRPHTKKHINKYYLIVPSHEETPSKIFSKIIHNKSISKDDSGQNVTTNDGVEHNNKMFQVIFHTPKMYEWKWRDLFNALYKFSFPFEQALSACYEKDRMITLSVFESMIYSKNEHAKPRNIVAFINRLVGLGHINIYIPNAIKAICIKHKSEFDGREKLYAEASECRNDIVTRYCLLDDDHWRYYIVAIHNNCNLEDAKREMMDNAFNYDFSEWRKNINHAKGRILLLLKENADHEVFKEAVSQFITRNHTADDIGNVLAFISSELHEILSNEQQICKLLIDRLNDTKMWHSLSTTGREGIEYGLRCIAKGESKSDIYNVENVCCLEHVSVKDDWWETMITLLRNEDIEPIGGIHFKINESQYLVMCRKCYSIIHNECAYKGWMHQEEIISEYSRIVHQYYECKHSIEKIVQQGGSSNVNLYDRVREAVMLTKLYPEEKEVVWKHLFDDSAYRAWIEWFNDCDKDVLRRNAWKICDYLFINCVFDKYWGNHFDNNVRENEFMSDYYIIANVLIEVNADQRLFNMWFCHLYINVKYGIGNSERLINEDHLNRRVIWDCIDVWYPLLREYLKQASSEYMKNIMSLIGGDPVGKLYRGDLQRMIDSKTEEAENTPLLPSP